MDKAILDENNNVIFVDDLMRWAAWFEKNFSKRRIARDTVGNERVSTVFLGMNHAWDEENDPPAWFETMTFTGESMSENGCWRYETWEEAKAGHDKVVKGLRNKTK